MSPRLRLHIGICLTTFSNPRLEAISSCHVRWYGGVSGIPCAGWLAHVWLLPDAEANWLVVASFTGSPVYSRCHTICSTLLLLFPNSLTYRCKARIPESWYPGKVDTLGSSHQIFHVLIVLAVISHLKGLLVAFDHRHGALGSVCWE